MTPSDTTSPSAGLLITNLGSPAAPTTAAVRQFLAEFLSDPRVIEVPRVLWWFILNGVILRIRPRRSAAAYRKVWRETGSPLLDISQRQAGRLQSALGARFPRPLKVVLGMRYGVPSIAQALAEHRASGVQRLLILPLYPQYSATTTASTFDAVASVLKTWRALPELRFLTHYHNHEGYINALARSIREHWQQHGESERLLFSFHGIPERYSRAGDPYYTQCQITARTVATRLDLAEGRWAIAFQSRFGREPWLSPYTDQLLIDWGKKGVKSVEVICPGFAADCLETLEEIAHTDGELFLRAGGKEFRYIPALNDRPDHMQALIDIVLGATEDWRLEQHTMKATVA
jgi:ferrochelatase